MENYSSDQFEGVNQQQDLQEGDVPEKKGLAIASLILGIVSMLCCFIYAGVLGVVGLILGIRSLSKKQGGRGMAIGGIITSAIGILLLIVWIVVTSVFAWLNYAETGTTSQSLPYELEAELTEYDEMGNEAELNEYDETEGVADIFAGKSYEGGGGSVIYFEEDGTYTWYRDDADHADNYYVGTYEVYLGEEAAEYIENDLAEYGVTQEELDDYMTRNTDSDFYTMKNLTCLILNAEQAIIDGTDQADGGYTTPYMGFMQDGYFDAANMRTASYVTFTERN